MSLLTQVYTTLQISDQLAKEVQSDLLILQSYLIAHKKIQLDDRIIQNYIKLKDSVITHSNMHNIAPILYVSQQLNTGLTEEEIDKIRDIRE